MFDESPTRSLWRAVQMEELQDPRAIMPLLTLDDIEEVFSVASSGHHQSLPSVASVHGIGSPWAMTDVLPEPAICMDDLPPPEHLWG